MPTTPRKPLTDAQRRAQSARAKGKRTRQLKSAAPAPVDIRDAWDRQHDEGDEAWRAFAAYRDSTPPRSLRRTAAHLGYADQSLVARWSAEHGWQDRVAAWDREQDRVRRDASLQEVADMGRRQAQQAQAMQLALSQSAQELLQRIHRARAAGADPFAGMTMRELMRASAEAGRAFAQVVQVERLARGASTQNIGGHDGGPLSAQHEEARAWAASASRTELDAFLTGVDAGRERERHAQQKDAARRPRNSPTTQE